ncbi:MAG: nicotinamide riboside transporter PnuC [Clostridium chrysemydis]|uniref:nicotinamide riboside transporter PnuC n=1 Tax=Clostridium chrysemydis TaxID=2665504 RepID=UPI003F3378F7
MQKLINQMTKTETWGTLLFIISLLIVQFTTGSTLLGLATGILGIFYVILVRMGSKWCYILGGMQMLMYIFIALNSRFYGDVTLNTVNFILQFIGWYNWSKREDSNGVVIPKNLTMGQTSGLITVWIVIWILGTYILHILGGNTPYLDSFATVTSILAMILSINSYRQQWILWCGHNLVATIMWILAITRGELNATSMAIMMFAYLCNSILGYKHWRDLYFFNKKLNK